MSLEMQLAQLIHLVDSAVFPRQPLKIVVVDELPPPGKPQFSFGRDSVDRDKSFYLIFSGLAHYFTQEAFPVHAMLEPDALASAYKKGILAFTLEEMLLGGALHEVRHRVQYFLKASLFNQSHTDQVLRCRYWGELVAKEYENIQGGDLEFDARFVESYGAHEFRQGRFKSNSWDLRNLLCMTPEQFLGKEKKN